MERKPKTRNPTQHTTQTGPTLLPLTLSPHGPTRARPNSLSPPPAAQAALPAPAQTRAPRPASRACPVTPRRALHSAAPQTHLPASPRARPAQTARVSPAPPLPDRSVPPDSSSFFPVPRRATGRPRSPAETTAAFLPEPGPRDLRPASFKPPVIPCAPPIHQHAPKP